jgi:hypothetical protein
VNTLSTRCRKALANAFIVPSSFDVNCACVSCNCPALFVSKVEPASGPAGTGPRSCVSLRYSKSHLSISQTSNDIHTNIVLQMLPNELVLMLRERWPCRELQIRQLSALLSVPHPQCKVSCNQLTAAVSIRQCFYFSGLWRACYWEEQCDRIVSANKRITTRDSKLQRVCDGQTLARAHRRGRM